MTPTHDYTANMSLRPPGENPLMRKHGQKPASISCKWPGVNGLAGGRASATTETLVESFPPRRTGKLNRALKKEELPRSLCGSFLWTFHRQGALNPDSPERRNPFISTSEENFLPDIKRRIRNSVVGWPSRALGIIVEKAARFFEDSLQE